MKKPSISGLAPQSQVQQAYRVTAVRRPQGSDTQALKISDEELAAALWARRPELRNRLRTLACQVLGKSKVDLELTDVRPGDGARLELVLTNFDANGVSGLSGAVILAVTEQLTAELHVPIAVAAAPEGPVPPSAADAPRSGWDKLAPVLGAIAGGIGVIGFVTFVGGVIVWGRLNKYGLPAAPALSVYAKQDLLVVGAQTLVPEVLVAALLVVVFSWAFLWWNSDNLLAGRRQTVLAGKAQWFMFSFVLVALLATLIALTIVHSGIGSFLPFWPLAVVAAVVGAEIASMVGRATRQFVVLAATNFVLIGMFMTLLAYWHARADSQVRGAALIRDNRTAIVGIYLTEGEGRVYLAVVKPDDTGGVDKNSSRMVGIDKSQITDLAVAGAQPIKQALADADTLGRELCEQQPRLKAADVPQNCSTAPPGLYQPKR